MSKRAAGSRHARSSASAGLLLIASSTVVGSGPPADSCGCLFEAGHACLSEARACPSVLGEPGSGATLGASGCGATLGGSGSGATLGGSAPECCADSITRAEEGLVSSSPGRRVPGRVIATYNAAMTASTAQSSPSARLIDRSIRCAAARRVDRVYARDLAPAIGDGSFAIAGGAAACKVSDASPYTGIGRIARNTNGRRPSWAPTAAPASTPAGRVAAPTPAITAAWIEGVVRAVAVGDLTLMCLGGHHAGIAS